MNLEEFLEEASPRRRKRSGSTIDEILEEECDGQWREAILEMLHDPKVPDSRLGDAIAKKFGKGSPDSVRRWREREGVR